MIRIVTLGFLITGCGAISYDKQRCIVFGKDCPKRTLQVYETIINEASESGEDGQDGTDGLPGLDGINGKDGQDGSSCTVVQTNTGAVITCDDGSYAEVLHGSDGLDGLDGQDGMDGQDGQDAPVSPFQIVEVIDPCGKQTAFDEVILRMANGQLVAFFASHGGFLAILGPGTYMTTDGTSCIFKVHADLTVTW